MGFALSWLGVKTVTPNIVLEALGLGGTGELDEVPDAPLNGVALVGGWYLVIANRQPPEFFPDPILERLSTHGEVVVCFVEEHVMYSSAAGWNGGREVWWVVHDAQRDIEHLETRGDLPAIFTSIRDESIAAQEAAGRRSATVDYTFDVPVQLAEALTGYRHDHDIPDGGENPFEVLTAIP